MPWVLGGLGAVALLVGVGVIVLVAAASDDDAPKPAPTAAATAATPPVVETAPLADAAPSAKVASTVTPPSTRFTASPGPTPTPPSRPTVTVVVPTAPTPTSTSPPLAPFNRAKAQAAIDRAGANLGSCVQSAGPFGSGSIRIDFEPDGRVGTLTRPPFAGTPEGSCISARFLSIRIGPFLGTTQSIERAFIMQQ